MKYHLLYLFFIFRAVDANCQRLAERWWYGKKDESFFITKDSSGLEFKADGLRSKTYDFKFASDSIFLLGDITIKQTRVENSKGEEDIYKYEKLVEWYPFKMVKFNPDTLVIEYASSKTLKPSYFNKLSLFSYRRIQQIKNPVFINLEYNRSGFHVFIDSTGFVKYWFDEVNFARIPIGEIVQSKLTNIQLNQLKYWIKDDEIQNLPENFGNAYDGTYGSLLIKTIPRNIFSYGYSKGELNTVLHNLFKFLHDIPTERHKAE